MDGGWISVLSPTYGHGLQVVSLRGRVRRLDTQRNLGVRPADALLELDWDVSLTPAYRGGTCEGHILMEYPDEPAAAHRCDAVALHHTGQQYPDCTGLSCCQEFKKEIMSSVIC